MLFPETSAKHGSFDSFDALVSRIVRCFWQDGELEDSRSSPMIRV